jgi:hypothetical protein
MQALRQEEVRRADDDDDIKLMVTALGCLL